MKGRINAQLDPPTPKSIADDQLALLDGVALSDEVVLEAENLVMQTAFLRSRPKPISLLLIGKPGIGKSRLLSCLEKIAEVSYANDITPKHLVKFLEEVKKGEKKYLVIPDYTSCLSHSKATQKTLNAILRGMTEEGISSLKAYQLEFESDFPVRAGLITATTSSSYREFAVNWKKTGFLSRLLPFSFTHSYETRARILDEIDAKKADIIGSIKLRVERKPKNVVCDPALLSQLRAYSELLSKETASEPYRHQIQLTSLPEAAAVLRGSSRVEQQDVETIHRLSNWINYDFKEL